MNLTHAIAPDELLLAELASAKLAKLIQGLMTVGVGSLKMASPSAFLAGRDRPLLAFVEVLHCVGLRPGCGDEWERLRQHAEQLADLTRQFRQDLLQLAAWRTLSPTEVRARADRLVASYTALRQSLAAFRALIGADTDYSGEIHQGREMIDAFLKDALCPAGDSKAAPECRSAATGPFALVRSRLHSNSTNTCPPWTKSPALGLILATLPAMGAVITVSIFMASRTIRTSLTWIA
jgi:hypothetical protein